MSLLLDTQCLSSTQDVIEHGKALKWELLSFCMPILEERSVGYQKAFEFQLHRPEQAKDKSFQVGQRKNFREEVYYLQGAWDKYLDGWDFKKGLRKRKPVICLCLQKLSFNRERQGKQEGNFNLFFIVYQYICK